MTTITKGWPPKRRKQQAENCRRTKPWTRATGPLTLEGKESVKMNAIIHGLYSYAWRMLRRALHKQRQYLARLNARLRLEKCRKKIVIIGIPLIFREEKRATFWQASKALPDKALALGCTKYWPHMYPEGPAWIERMITEEYGEEEVL